MRPCTLGCYPWVSLSGSKNLTTIIIDNKECGAPKYCYLSCTQTSLLITQECKDTEKHKIALSNCCPTFYFESEGENKLEYIESLSHVFMRPTLDEESKAIANKNSEPIPSISRLNVAKLGVVDLMLTLPRSSILVKGLASLDLNSVTHLSKFKSASSPQFTFVESSANYGHFHIHV